ncbi:MAG: hypothetical protein IPN76_08585 [Saprospiraceae bacterium]|nr:hypothetical protein [Saprospiraceae bacterium]
MNENAYFWVMKKEEIKKDEIDWWDELTPAQQEELQLAIDESYDESNLVSDEDAQAMIQSWLNKKAD